MLNKMLSSIGIGGARVDTKLDTSTLRQGELATGTVVVFGGKVEQEINDIYLEVKTEYRKEIDDRKFWVPVTIRKFRVAERFVIGAGELKEIPFSFILPKETPLTVGGTKVWIETDLDIKNAVDSGDKDLLSVQPSREVNAVLTTMQKMGFVPKEIVNKQDRRGKALNSLSFVQEFEYKPMTGQFRGILDEIELQFYPQSDQETVVLMQVDRKARGLAGFLEEALEMDETFVRFIIKPTNVDSIPDMVQDLIYKHSHR